MFTKRYLYDAGRCCCLEMLCRGFAAAFEETLRIAELNRLVRAQALAGQGRTMPADLTADPRVMQIVMKTLEEEESADRAGLNEESLEVRLGLADKVKNIEGYQWLAEHLYRSSLRQVGNKRQEARVLEKLGLLDEQIDNIFTALKYMKQSLRCLRSCSKNENWTAKDDEKVIELCENLIRLNCKIGLQFHEKESDRLGSVKDSKAALYYRKALRIATKMNIIDKQALCHGLLGGTIMKFKEYSKALKHFEEYHNLSLECEDAYNISNANFALSEVYKSLGDLEKSEQAMKKCLEEAKGKGHMVPMIFASISFGQVETAKRNYQEAHLHFEAAYRKQLFSGGHLADSLSQLCRVMCGVGRAHLSFGRLTSLLAEPPARALPDLLQWRDRSGPLSKPEVRPSSAPVDLELREATDPKILRALLVKRLVAIEVDQGTE